MRCNKMAASYKKLFKLLIDRDMKKKELAEKAGISNCRIYLSCDNLFTITGLSSVYDPEAFGSYDGYGTSGKTYPLQRTISVGVNLNF